MPTLSGEDDASQDRPDLCGSSGKDRLG
jgi:hypothetical protein